MSANRFKPSVANSGFFDKGPMKSIESTDTQDIVNIKRFLFDKKAMLVQLEKLELALQMAAGKRYDHVARKLVDYDPLKSYKQHKLLTNYLRDWATENGFSGIIKIKNFLDNVAFSTLLATRTLFIDNQFLNDLQHGELTHLIQWFCITEHAKDNVGFLSMPAAAIYEVIGKHDLVPGTREYWTQTFEVNEDYDVASHSDFLFGMECAEQFPVLFTLLRSRYDKETYHKYFLPEAS